MPSPFQTNLQHFRFLFAEGRFRILLTPEILSEYQKEAVKPPQFQLLPVINPLEESGVAIHLDEYMLGQSTIP